MKIIVLLLAVLACSSISQAQKKQKEPPKEARIERNFNSQWTFNYFPEESAGTGCEGPGFNDSRWPAVSLPHSWNTYETTGIPSPFSRRPAEAGETFWWTGWGWYRKHFSISADYSDHKVLMNFEGVQKYCKVWVNGKYEGDHKGGYEPFGFDITEAVRFGQDNVIAIAVSYLAQEEFSLHPDSAGSANISCGIYRNARLVLAKKPGPARKNPVGREVDANAADPASNESQLEYPWLGYAIPDWMRANAPEYLKPAEKNFSMAASDSLPQLPVKIILKASHSKVPADRGSVYIVTAGAVDSKGNLVKDANNNLKWSVSGPGKLVGPSYYTSYKDSLLAGKDGYYISMPVTNVIRSLGKSGKIIVTVFSAGLSSATVETEAEVQMAENDIVTEPRLEDEGRKRVASSQLVTQRLDRTPAEIGPVTEDLRLTMKGKAELTSGMKVYFRLKNPSLDTTTVEVNALAGLLGAQLYNNGGSLSAADLNYNAEHFNTCRLIAGYISRTKLPPLFKESLRRYYSDLIIEKGSEKNAGEEMNWLNWIPSGGVVVIVPDEKTVKNQKGVIYAKDPDLTAIIKTVYPQFVKFSDEGKDRALIFISKMNPSIIISHSEKASRDSSAIQPAPPLYVAKKGQPVLIPEYKFISE